MKKLMIVGCALAMAGCEEMNSVADLVPPHAQPFGVTAKGEKASLYTLKGAGGLTLEVTDFGGRVVRCWAPDKNGKLADVTLGWNTPSTRMPRNRRASDDIVTVTDSPGSTTCVPASAQVTYGPGSTTTAVAGRWYAPTVGLPLTNARGLFAMSEVAYFVQPSADTSPPPMSGDVASNRRSRFALSATQAVP